MIAAKHRIPELQKVEHKELRKVEVGDKELQQVEAKHRIPELQKAEAGYGELRKTEELLEKQKEKVYCQLAIHKSHCH